jgi:hypothetical protein
MKKQLLEADFKNILDRWGHVLTLPEALYQELNRYYQAFCELYQALE